MGNTFSRWGLGLVLQVGLTKKGDPTLNPKSREYIFIKNQDPTLFLWLLEGHKLGLRLHVGTC